MSIITLSKISLLKKILIEEGSSDEIIELIDDFSEDFNSLDEIIIKLSKQLEPTEEKAKDLIRLRSCFMCLEDYIREINDLITKQIEKN